jgi:hypothetical protein
MRWAPSSRPAYDWIEWGCFTVGSTFIFLNFIVSSFPLLSGFGRLGEMAQTQVWHFGVGLLIISLVIRVGVIALEVIAIRTTVEAIIKHPEEEYVSVEAIQRLRRALKINVEDE